MFNNNCWGPCGRKNDIVPKPSAFNNANVEENHYKKIIPEIEKLIKKLFDKIESIEQQINSQNGATQKDIRIIPTGLDELKKNINSKLIEFQNTFNNRFQLIANDINDNIKKELHDIKEEQESLKAIALSSLDKLDMVTTDIENIKNIQEKIGKLETTILGLEEDKKGLNSALEIQKLSKEKEIEEIQKLSKEKEIEEIQKLSKEKEIEKIQKLHEEEKNKLGEKINNLNLEIEKLNKTNKTKQEQLTKVKNQLSEKENEINQANNNFNTAEVEKNELNKNLEDKNKEINELKTLNNQQLLEQDKKIESLEKENNELNDEIKKLRQEVNNNPGSSEVSRLNDELEKRINELTKKAKELNDAKQEKKRLEEQVKEANKTKNSLEAKLNDKNTELENLKDENHELKNALNEEKEKACLKDEYLQQINEVEEEESSKLTFELFEGLKDEITNVEFQQNLKLILLEIDFLKPKEKEPVIDLLVKRLEEDIKGVIIPTLENIISSQVSLLLNSNFDLNHPKETLQQQINNQKLAENIRKVHMLDSTIKDILNNYRALIGNTENDGNTQKEKNKMSAAVSILLSNISSKEKNDLSNKLAFFLRTLFDNQINTMVEKIKGFTQEKIQLILKSGKTVPKYIDNRINIRISKIKEVLKPPVKY